MGAFGFFLSTCYAIVFGIILMIFNYQIAEMFTEVQSVLYELKFQGFLMGCLTLFIGSGATGATMFRVINKAGVYSIVMVINQVFVSTILSALALFTFNLRAAGIGYAFLVSWILTYVFTCFYMKN